MFSSVVIYSGWCGYRKRLALSGADWRDVMEEKEKQSWIILGWFCLWYAVVLFGVTAGLTYLASDQKPEQPTVYTEFTPAQSESPCASGKCPVKKPLFVERAQPFVVR